MNYQMPEIVSEPVTMHKPMPRPMPMPQPAPMPMSMPEPMPMPESMHERYYRPMPEPRSMPVPAPTREVIQKIEVEKVEIHAETQKKSEYKTEKMPEAALPLYKRHMLWTYSLVISVVEGLPDVQNCSRRVAYNNNEMLEHFKTHTSKDSAKTIAEMLNQNLVYIVQLAQTIKGGNQKNVTEAWGRVTHNADRMIAAVCEAVPHMECEKMKKHYYEFLELLKDEITFKTGKRTM